MYVCSGLINSYKSLQYFVFFQRHSSTYQITICKYKQYMTKVLQKKRVPQNLNNKNKYITTRNFQANLCL